MNENARSTQNPCATSFVALALFLSLIVGCGPSGRGGKPTAAVNGLVSLNGAPIETGTINFLPAEKDQAAAASATITAGKYSLDSPIGKVRVQIVATKKTGNKIPGSSEPIDEVISIIPAKYAGGAELTIPAAGGEQNFALTDP